jgi:hypothetical protein
VSQAATDFETSDRICKLYGRQQTFMTSHKSSHLGFLAELIGWSVVDVRQGNNGRRRSYA